MTVFDVSTFLLCFRVMGLYGTDGRKDGRARRVMQSIGRPRDNACKCCDYLRRRLASGEGIVALGVRVCVCPPSRDCTPSAARVTRRIPFSSLLCFFTFTPSSTGQMV